MKGEVQMVRFLHPREVHVRRIRKTKRDRKADALKKTRRDPASGTTDVTAAHLDIEKATLKASPERVNPIVNVGMERNEEDELTAGEIKLTE